MISDTMEAAVVGGGETRVAMAAARARSLDILGRILGDVLAQEVAGRRELRALIAPVILSGGRSAPAVARLQEAVGISPPPLRLSTAPWEPCSDDEAGLLRFTVSSSHG